MEGSEEQVVWRFEQKFLLWGILIGRKSNDFIRKIDLHLHLNQPAEDPATLRRQDAGMIICNADYRHISREE